ncbi:MAG: O-antigen ligase family protein [Erysipelotrichaceae bacterium]|nr:O-antigen ligase family protein [Erysipelotrichaceae bacterium]
MIGNVLNKARDLITRFGWIIVFLLMIPFFNDGYVGFTLIDNWLMEIFKNLAFIGLILIMVIKKRKPSLLFIVLMAMQIWWMISTMLNYPLSETEVYHKMWFDIIESWSVALVVECFNDDPKSLFSGLILNLELCIYPGLVSKILDYPGNNYYILGYYSLAILWILPAIITSFGYMFYHKRYIRGSVLVLASLALTALLGCATITVAILGLIGAAVLGLLCSRLKKKESFKLPAWLLLVLALLGNAFVLFVYTGGKFPVIDLFIEKFLHKSTTFTERTIIWENAIKMIQEKPWIGHGYRPEVIGYKGRSFIHAHNQLLQQLNARGIIGFTLFILFHIVLVRKLDKTEDSFMRTIALASSFAVWITYMTEGYKKFFRLYLVMFIAYFIRELTAKKKE